jgi:peptidoglycan/LPS O-acetylase OafA/YrhL
MIHKTIPSADSVTIQTEMVPLTVPVKTKADTGGRRKLSVNMDTHLGLRGLLTLWIVVFHSFLYSKAGWLAIQGSVWMTQFFLLSGFALGVVYLDMCKPGGSPVWRQFFYNRLIRIMPLYIVINLLALPATFLGWGAMDWAGSIGAQFGQNVALSFIPIQTWIVFSLGNAFVGPGWTISTLLFMYLFFPLFGRHVHWVGKRLNLWCHIYNVTQITLAVVILFTTGSFEGATMVPYTRFMVFIMGMLAAQDCLKVGQEPGYLSIFTPSLLYGESDGGLPNSEAHWSWARKVDATTLLLAVCFLYYGVMDSLGPIGTFSIYVVSFGNFWLQLFAAWPMMVWMVAMTRDGGRSRTARVLNTRAMQWLGRHSMAIYLIHEPLLYYWNALWNTVILGNTTSIFVNADTGLTEAVAAKYLSMAQHKAAGNLAPEWTVAVIVPCALLLGWLLSRGIDEPCSKCLRKQRK